MKPELQPEQPQAGNIAPILSSALLDIGSRWKEIEARIDRVTGKPKGRRTVYVVELFTRCDGEPMVRHSRQKHGSQRQWITTISSFKTRYAPMSNAEVSDGAGRKL